MSATVEAASWRRNCLYWRPIREGRSWCRRDPNEIRAESGSAGQPGDTATRGLEEQHPLLPSTRAATPKTKAAVESTDSRHCSRSHRSVGFGIQGCCRRSPGMLTRERTVHSSDGSSCRSRWAIARLSSCGRQVDVVHHSTRPSVSLDGADVQRGRGRWRKNSSRVSLWWLLLIGCRGTAGLTAISEQRRCARHFHNNRRTIFSAPLVRQLCAIQQQRGYATRHDIRFQPMTIYSRRERSAGLTLDPIAFLRGCRRKEIVPKQMAPIATFPAWYVFLYANNVSVLC